MKNQEPKALWASFYSLTQIPRPSGKRKEIADFLVNYGKSLGLETLQDEIGNVLIRKPASPGMENHPGVILQGHMDMVPQKNSDKVFDFEKDAIQAYVEDNGEWVTADGTTLGADNGIGVATAMAILDDDTLPHPGGDPPSQGRKHEDLRSRGSCGLPGHRLLLLDLQAHYRAQSQRVSEIKRSSVFRRQNGQNG